MAGGDRFSEGVKQVLAYRSGFRCSRPSCRALTVGPAGDDERTNVGVAAHITAASPGGPRYDPVLSPEERMAVGNGIWLCQTHAKEVDDDPSRYSVEALRAWKQAAEQDAKALLGRPVDSHALEVSMEVTLQRGVDNGLLVTGATNLPDGTRLLVDLSTSTPGNLVGQAKTVIRGGYFVAGPYWSGKVPHSQGWYALRVLSYFNGAWQQPGHVQELVGRRGGVLAGRHVRDLHPDVADSERIVDARFECVAPPLNGDPVPGDTDVLRAVALVQRAVLSVDGEASACPVGEVVDLFKTTAGLRERDGWSGRLLPDATVLVEFSYWDGETPADAQWRVLLNTGEVRYVNVLGRYLSWLPAS